MHATHYDKTPGGHWHFDSSDVGALDDIKELQQGISCLSAHKIVAITNVVNLRAALQRLSQTHAL